ncbi:juvenile hormone esterase-like [Rhynchophorus ferrugineus]|uniref:juvenile hormone esterase-like n=1 Tax=Rhynchophorus ferrugineus TaxID=354439 RepID=UPI003FCDCAEB
MVFLWFTILVLCTINSAYGQVVQTTYGPIIGTIKSTISEGKPYYAYQGIPYAKPPLGELRFAAPVPPETWLLPKLTMVDKGRCIQLNVPTGTEDCLYLNVYSPTTNSSAKLPVMVWIYGGFFLWGDSQYNDAGPDFFLDQDVVFVDFNYRLGVLGFLSTDDEVAPGNWALKDQIMALKWVQENIERFGGDKDSITVFGQSAGAGATSYLSLIPETKGLFHKVILQSGSALNMWSLARQPRRAAFGMGKAFGIETNDAATLIAGLRNISGLQLTVVGLSQTFAEAIESDPLGGLVFGPSIEPSIDGALVTFRSYEKMANGDFHKLPFMMGFTSQEGGQTIQVINWIKAYLTTFDTNPLKLIPNSMNLNDTLMETEVALLIRTHYFGVLPVIFLDKEFIQFMGDDQFVRAVHQAAKLMSQYTDVYLYRFSYQGDVYSDRSNTDVYHAEELNYLFEITNNPQLTSENDLAKRHQLVKMWTNFAKYSNPTPNVDPELDSIIWEKMSYNQDKYLDIGKELKMSSDLSLYNIDFWETLYKVYGKSPFDTY